ncbi:MAG: carbon storage regulator CsrA [Nitriliruptoraceae bacterium]|nr:carbon storage regulator CsrA [Nitriliruptoraceae bacterium]
MLVLSRRPGESIVIGNDIVVTILDVRGDQIRVGIAAPRDVQVHREEVFRQLEAENAAAQGSAARARQLVARMPNPPRGAPNRARPVGLSPKPERAEPAEGDTDA